jgi:glycosyltransferase involved in cell wall biosynthesis
MRIGNNPLKGTPQLEAYKRHRIIMPIYIGDNHEYFKESDKTLALCLRSLFSTIDLNLCSVTVINNNSIARVDDILRPYIESKQIDKYIRNQTNRGKPDAVAAEIMATYEPFVTLTDCDVMYHPGWMTRLEEIFANFTGVGGVSPFPAPNHQFYLTGTTWLDAIFRLSIRRGKYVTDEELDRFIYSIGKSRDFFNDSVRRRQFATNQAGKKALIGCGHFVVMFRRKVFEMMRYEPKLAGASNGEAEIDSMVEYAGYQRLSTQDYHVYHLGNAIEDWMETKVAETELQDRQPLLKEGEFAKAMSNTRCWAAIIPRAARSLLLKVARTMWVISERIAARS